MTKEQTKALIESRVGICFLCKWIVEDSKLNGKLTDWPLEAMGRGQFPLEGKIRHIRLEMGVNVGVNV